MQKLAVVIVFCLANVAVAGEPKLSPSKAAAEISSTLRAADKIELLSLEGLEGVAVTDHDKGNTFHGYPILGSVAVSDEKDRAALTDSLTRSIARGPVRMIACFFPRHGIRAALANQNVELLICFECATVYYFRAGESYRLNIDETPAKLLNALLAKATPAGKKASGTR